MNWYLEKLEEIATKADDEKISEEAICLYTNLLDASKSNIPHASLINQITKFINQNIPTNMEYNKLSITSREDELNKSVESILLEIDFYINNSSLTTLIRGQFKYIKDTLLGTNVDINDKSDCIHLYYHYKEQADSIISADNSRPNSK